MKPGLTEIVCVIDRSGSMEAIQSDAIGAFNAFLKEQQKNPGEANFSMTLFNTTYELRHQGTPIKWVVELTNKTYMPSGMTALFDAIGKTIDEIGERLAKTPEDQRPELVVFVILTDGMENSSKEYSLDQVKRLIRQQSEQWHWRFEFLAAGPEAMESASNLEVKTSGGIVRCYAAGNAAEHHSQMQAMSQCVTGYRSNTGSEEQKPH